MSKFNAWQKAKSNLNAAKNWMGNKDKTDSQDGRNYTLKVSIGRESLQYCGQEYAGANNYHSSTEFFNSAVEQVIKNNSAMIFKEAIGILSEKEREMAVESRDEVEAMLAEIDAANI